jgi:hypothetical protein
MTHDNEMNDQTRARERALRKRANAVLGVTMNRRKGVYWLSAYAEGNFYHTDNLDRLEAVILQRETAYKKKMAELAARKQFLKGANKHAGD